MHFLIFFLIGENNLFLKTKYHYFTMDFSVELVGLGFLKALYSYTERGFTVWWCFGLLSQSSYNGFRKRLRKPNERVLMLSRHFRIENSEPWTIPDYIVSQQQVPLSAVGICLIANGWLRIFHTCCNCK